MNRLYHIEAQAERAALVALVESPMTSIDESAIDDLTVEDLAPLRAVLRALILKAESGIQARSEGAK